MSQTISNKPSAARRESALTDLTIKPVSRFMIAVRESCRAVQMHPLGDDLAEAILHMSLSTQHCLTTLAEVDGTAEQKKQFGKIARQLRDEIVRVDSLMRNVRYVACGPVADLFLKI